MSPRVVLAGPPNLAGLYRRAGLSAAKGAASRRGPIPVPVPNTLATWLARRGAPGSRPAPRRVTSSAAPVLPDVTVAAGGLRGETADAAAFQHLVGGAAGDTLHPGYVHVLAFPVAMELLAREDVPLPLLGMVHLSNRITQHRAVAVGEELAVEVALSPLRAHRKGAEVDAVATVTAAGEPVLTDVSTYLAKGVAVPEQRSIADSGAAAADSGKAGAEAGDTGCAVRRTGSGGYEPPRAQGRWRLAADTGRRYAEVSGDVNPIHLSAATARAFGFPRAIAHGMYTASRALTASRVPLDGELTWEVSFEAPVLLPSRPEIAHERETDGTVRTELWRPAREDKPPRRHLHATAAPRVGYLE